MPSSVLIIRADASVAMGTGHVIRCLALAQAWQDRGGRVIFVMAQSTPALNKYLASENVEVVSVSVLPGDDQDAAQLTGIARQQNAKWVIVDGYHFTSNYQRTLKRAGLQLLLVDDTGESAPYYADIILNQNITACEELYARREPHTRLLLGNSYVMLRRQFTSWQNWVRTFPEVAQSVLLTVGGTDPDGLTLRLIEAFTQIGVSDFKVRVIVGGSNPRIEEVRRAIDAAFAEIELLTEVQDMAGIMAASDLAVVCGGGTLWEALSMGCATLSYSRGGIQSRINEKLAAADAIIDLGPVESFDSESLQSPVKDLRVTSLRRQSMAHQGRTAVDGNGASRVVSSVENWQDGLPAHLGGADCANPAGL